MAKEENKNEDNQCLERVQCMFHLPHDEEKQTKIAWCLEDLLDKENNLNESKIKQKLKKECNYKCIVKKDGNLIAVNHDQDETYFESKWKIKDEKKQIDDEYTIYVLIKTGP